MYKNYIKRFLDIVLSAAAILILLPLLIIISVAVRINMGTPIIFVQKRVGKDERVFNMYKFRSMNNKCDDEGNLLPDEDRVTRLGNFLRGSSLDELPELINILKGDISIIGPRPLLVQYLPYYSDTERQRHSVRGGLTVPEVLYDNIMPTWEEQFAYEVDYVNNVSFLLDMKILLKTMKGIIARKDVNYGSYFRKPLDEERKELLNAEKPYERKNNSNTPA